MEFSGSQQMSKDWMVIRVRVLDGGFAVTIEERIEKLSQAIKLAKNDCHVPSGPKEAVLYNWWCRGAVGRGGVLARTRSGTVAQNVS